MRGLLQRNGGGVGMWRFGSALGLILAGFFLAAAGPVTPKRVRLCADTWCPYNCAPGATRPGFAVEIARQVFAPAGYDVSYTVLGWTRCIADARAGRFDAIIGAIPSDAPDFTFPHRPIGISGDGFASRANAGYVYRGIGSLDGHVLGVIRDYAFTGPIGAYVNAHANDRSRIEFVSGEGAMAKNLAKLAAGHIDFVLDDDNVLRHAIAEQGYSGQLVVATGGNSTPVFIAFSPATGNRAELAGMLDEGIDRLRDSGELATILAAYHVPVNF